MGSLRLVGCVRNNLQAAKGRGVAVDLEVRPLVSRWRLNYETYKS